MWRDNMRKNGFTLIELLVVISIISVLSGLILVNVVGVRQRAADARRKSDLRQLKSALRLYYNDFQNYPVGAGTLDGCGAAGDTACTTQFSAGSGPTMYMSELPAEYEYYSDGLDGFLLVVTLDNLSDTEIATSQTRCNLGSRAAYYAGPPATDEYFVCED